MAPAQHRIATVIYLATVLVIALAVGSALALGPDSSTDALLAARYTARAAFVVFTALFIAGPIARIWPQTLFARLHRFRRHLGLATALAMAAHLVALAINIGTYRPRPFGALAAGAVAYLFVAGMALTANEGARRSMGRWWGRLHSTGLAALWLGFANGYTARLAKPGYESVGLIFTPIVACLLIVRIWAWLKPHPAM